MRIIFNVPLEQFGAALTVVHGQIRQGLDRYDRPGWGWRDGDFWVCGIKDGISCSWKPRAPNPNPEA